VLTGIATRLNDGHIGITTGPVDESATEASGCSAETQQARQCCGVERCGPCHQCSDAITHLQAAATVSATVAEQSQSSSGFQRRRSGCRCSRRRSEVVAFVRCFVHDLVANDAQRWQDAGDVTDTGCGHSLGARWTRRRGRRRNNA